MTKTPRGFDTIETRAGPVEICHDKPPTGGVKRGGARRVSAKLRKAIKNRVHKGLTIKEACELADLSEGAWHKAFKQEHVKALYEIEKDKYIQHCEDLALRHKARALEVAAYLLDHAKNEQVRARMVEFFRREAAPSASITINNTVNSGGYEYARPGQRVVEIEGSAEDVTDQGPDNAGN